MTDSGKRAKLSSSRVSLCSFVSFVRILFHRTLKIFHQRLQNIWESLHTFEYLRFHTRHSVQRLLDTVHWRGYRVAKLSLCVPQICLHALRCVEVLQTLHQLLRVATLMPEVPGIGLRI